MKPYDKALDAIFDRINTTPPMHQSDFEAIVDLFNQLLTKGTRAGSVDEIGNYLMSKGMGRDMARDIQMIYKVLEALHFKIKQPHWDDKFITDLL